MALASQMATTDGSVSAGTAKATPYRFGPIKWRLVFRRQPFVLVIVTFVTLMVPCQLYQSFGPMPDTFFAEPVTPWYPGEAALTRPLSPETVPMWLMGVICVLLISTIAVVEVLMGHRFHRNGSESLQAALWFILDAALVNILIYSVVALTKKLVGRNRPDFFARLESGDGHYIQEGMLSYPSGHASTSFACGWYWAIYFVWTYYWRVPANSQRSTEAQWLFDLKSFGKLIVIGIGPSLAMFIACSRIVDYRHNVSDVNAGALIGILGTSLLWLRTISVLKLQRSAAFDKLAVSNDLEMATAA